MNKNKIAEFVRVLNTEYVNRTEKSKQQYAKEGMEIMKTIAARLGYARGEYEVRFNPGGTAVSGDVCLETDHLYVSFSQYQLNGTFYFRSCLGRGNYSSHGHNNTMPWNVLNDLDKLIETIKIRCPGIPDRPALPDPKPSRPKKVTYAKVKGEWDNPKDALRAKLAMTRLRGKWSPVFIGILNYLLEVEPGEPIIVTSDGYILIDGSNVLLGHINHLVENCERVCEDVKDVTPQEKAYLLNLVKAYSLGGVH